jgi:putative ABC transport system permease protein
MLQDIRYALRTLAKSPGFTATVVLTLALGIGANTAIFSALYGVLLRPLPYPHPEQLVELSSTYQGFRSERPATYGQFQYLRDNTAGFTALAASTGLGVNLFTGTASEHLRLERVSTGYFRVLGVEPELGRTFLTEEDQPGGPNAVILSHGLWQRVMGGDSKVLGRTVMIDGAPFTVVGVMPIGFRPPEEADVWSTLAQVGRTVGSGQNLEVIGRLAPGISVGRAQTDEPTKAGFAATFHTAADSRVDFASLRELEGASIQTPLAVLFGTIALVLLIACANVAGLLLGRTAARRRELSVRAALGASRPRLMRQLLSESLILALMGGAAGLAVAGWGLEALRGLAPDTLPRTADIRLDGWALVFTAGVSIVTGLAFGLLPAWQMARTNLSEAFQEGAARTTAGTARGRLRHILVAGEIALSLVLLVGAGLMLRTFANLLHSDPGFDPHQVLAAEFWLTGSRYQTAPAINAYYRDLLRRVEGLPGVQSAAVVEAGMPLTRGGNVGVRIGGGDFRSSDYRGVSADYFTTLGVPLTQGRYLSGSDVAGGEPVAVVNRAFARRYLSQGDPLGAVITSPDLGGPRRVVGVVGDVTSSIGSPAQPTIIIPAPQEPPDLVTAFNGWFPIHLLVRTSGDPTRLVAPLKRAMQEADAQVPVGQVETMSDVLSGSLSFTRFIMVLLALFAGLAALLAVIGIYGLMSYLVAQRTREFGIRMALGARRSDVLAMVVRHGLALVGLGVLVGVGAAAAATRLLASELFGVRPIDIPTFAFVAAGVALVALVACYFPAQRATKVDPVVALRSE